MNTENTKRPGPLRGLRVVDTSTMYTTPLIATLLADHGAELADRLADPQPAEVQVVPQPPAPLRGDYVGHERTACASD